MRRWLVTSLCSVVLGLLPGVAMADMGATAPVPLNVMLVLTQVGEEGAGEGLQSAENTLMDAFRDHGHRVVDRDLVAQLLHREADLLKLYDVEAAKYLGSRLGADMMVRGNYRVHTQEKTYSALGGKQVTVSQATVSARAILVHSGQVLVTETAHARKPFDTTGEIALEKAAAALAHKLLAGIDDFRNRPTVDYRLVVFNISHPHVLALQEGLRNRVAGVRHVGVSQFIENWLELDVRVAKPEDVAFKSSLFAGLAGAGAGHFKVVGREGETVYLQRTGGQNTRPHPAPKSPNEPTKSRTAKMPEELPPPGPTPYKPGYRKSWAVVIGINNYRIWPKLTYAVKDAESMAERLRRLGFDDVTMLLDEQATQQNILRVLGDDLYTKTAAEDQVFIFFAGHGQTQDLPNGDKVGYIIPIDGDMRNYYSTAISMRQLQDLSDRLQAKHIFYAMDSCFSGLLLRLRGGADAAPSYSMLTANRARQVLTAGAAGEEVVEVSGHGLFTNVFLEGLGGAADLNRDGYIVASELYQFVTPRVLQESRNAQNPSFGRLGHDRGEFVFALNR